MALGYQDGECPVMCKAQALSDHYTASCHRDAGHSGAHRAFRVGEMTAVYWTLNEPAPFTFTLEGNKRTCM